MKKILLIVFGIIIVAILGRVGWAYYQVKSDEAKITNVPVMATTPPPEPTQMEVTILTPVAATAPIVATTTIPVAKLTVNGATSVLAKEAENLTLKWSSINADKFSSTQSTSKCFVTGMNKAETVTDNISSAQGTDASLVFTKDDLAFLGGCDMSITYIAKNSKTGKEARSTVHVLLPKNSETTKQLINIVSPSTKN